MYASGVLTLIADFKCTLANYSYQCVRRPWSNMSWAWVWRARVQMLTGSRHCLCLTTASACYACILQRHALPACLCLASALLCVLCYVLCVSPYRRTIYLAIMSSMFYVVWCLCAPYRRTIYLTIMSSMAFEEAGHKLMKIPMQEGQEHIMAEMIIECCAQVRV